MNERAKFGTVLIVGIIIGYIISPTKEIKRPSVVINKDVVVKKIEKKLLKCKELVVSIKKEKEVTKECKVKEMKLSTEEEKIPLIEEDQSEESELGEIKEYKPIKTEDVIFKELPIEGNEVAHEKIKDYRFKDPGKAFVTSKLFKELPKKLDYLNGSFTGQIVYTSGKKKDEVINLSLDINYQNEEGKAVGQFDLKLYERGELISSNGGDGNNHAIKIFNNSNDIIINVNPNSFLQILNTENKGVLLGNFYKEYKHVGIAQIQRKHGN